MALYSFEGNAPQVAESAYIHESAQIIGNVVIGEECFVGAGAIIRGDYGELLIWSGTAIE
jgi:phenylacetic acid degradation protein